MNRSRQLGFKILENKSANHFGGAYLRNSNPKSKRPITTKRCMHLVLRSSLATGRLSFLRKQMEIQNIISCQAKTFGVKVYRLSNAGNHLHLIVLPASRKAFVGFIRAVSGLIARLVLNVERAKAKSIRFWDKRPFTRIIEWGREFKSVCDYLLQNKLEALGFIPFQPRKYKLKPVPA